MDFWALKSKSEYEKMKVINPDARRVVSRQQSKARYDKEPVSNSARNKKQWTKNVAEQIFYCSPCNYYTAHHLILLSISLQSAT